MKYKYNEYYPKIMLETQRHWLIREYRKAYEKKDIRKMRELEMRKNQFLRDRERVLNATQT